MEAKAADVLVLVREACELKRLLKEQTFMASSDRSSGLGTMLPFFQTTEKGDDQTAPASGSP